MRSLLSQHHVANEIRLKGTQHKGSFLIVEGPDDGRFYRRFLDPRQCHLVVAHGKDILVSAVGLLDAEGFSGVLGLADADFDVLEGTAPPSPNIVHGDCHDLEAMLVRSPALDAVLHEFAAAEKLAAFEGQFGASVRKWLLETARCLGYLRWHSRKNNLNLRFDGLRFSKFVHKKGLRIDVAALVTEVRNHSQKLSIPQSELVAASWPAGANHDLWQVCCGHDMVELLTFALRGGLGSQQNLQPEQVARSLRLAYGIQDFCGSGTYASINEWETKTGFRVLPQT